LHAIKGPTTHTKKGMMTSYASMSGEYQINGNN